MWSWGQCLSAEMSDMGSPQGLNFSQSSEHLSMKYGKCKDWKIEACLFVTIKKVVKWLFRMSQNPLLLTVEVYYFTIWVIDRKVHIFAVITSKRGHSKCGSTFPGLEFIRFEFYFQLFCY